MHNNSLRLTVLPELGSCIAGLELKHQGFWLPVMRPMSVAAVAAGSSPDSSSYILAPYSNRIRDGRFSFGGKDFQLKPNWPDGKMTIHGEVHARAWETVEQSAETLTCRFAADAGLNFPFAYAVEAGFRLEGLVLELDLRLTNTSAGPMPAGLGHHPYFMRRLGSGNDPLVQFRAEKVYLTDQTRIPAGPAASIPAELDFGQPRAVGPTFIDNVFSGWDGKLSVDWGHFRMTLEAQPVFSHLVMFTAPDGTLALEPVTHATDGFNLMSQGHADTGVRVLEPGETLQGKVWIRLEGR